MNSMKNLDSCIGVTKLVALIIQANEVVCTCSGPDKNGLFAGFVTHNEDKYYRTILSTQPIFKNKRKALRAMKKLVKRIRKINLGV